MTLVTEERSANAREHWPVFVISLTDAEARRAAISARLAALSIPFEFIDAIDGRSGLPAEHEARVDRVKTERVLGRPMSDAEYAATLSHMLVYERIIAENLAGAIVLEDDAIVGHAFAEFRAKRCYEVGDLLQMDHVYGYVWKGAKTVPLFDGVVAAVAAKNAALATGYSISQRGARYFRAHGQPIISPPDWPVDVTGLPALLTLPCIVGHPPLGGDDSSLGTERRKLEQLADRRRGRRFLKRAYWKGKWLRLWMRRVS